MNRNLEIKNEVKDLTINELFESLCEIYGVKEYSEGKKEVNVYITDYIDNVIQRDLLRYSDYNHLTIEKRYNDNNDNNLYVGFNGRAYEYVSGSNNKFRELLRWAFNKVVIEYEDIIHFIKTEPNFDYSDNPSFDKQIEFFKLYENKLGFEYEEGYYGEFYITKFENDLSIL